MLSFKQCMNQVGEPMEVNIEPMSGLGCCAGNYFATRERHLESKEHKKNNPPEPRGKLPYVIEKFSNG